MHKTIAAASISVLLAGCAQEAGQGFSNPGGIMGEATKNNTAIMNGSQDYAINLGRRFASEVPSTITFAFNTPIGTVTTTLS